MAEDYFINNDIKTICVSAKSFPHGVLAAHQQLHSLLDSSAPRTFYGISWGGKNGDIVYKAAAEELSEGEAEKLNLEKFVIRKGKYASELLKDWRKGEAEVGETFRQLLSDPRIDKNGYCVEVYLNEKDMLCLVTLDPGYDSQKEKVSTQ
jgi:hypothetical protein